MGFIKEGLVWVPVEMDLRLKSGLLLRELARTRADPGERLKLTLVYCSSDWMRSSLFFESNPLTALPVSVSLDLDP